MYRTHEAVTYVHDGKVVTVAANRHVDIPDEVAAKLGDKVTKDAEKVGLAFPDGQPVIDVLRLNPAADGAYDAHSDKSEKSAKK